MDELLPPLLSARAPVMRGPRASGGERRPSPAVSLDTSHDVMTRTSAEVPTTPPALRLFQDASNFPPQSPPLSKTHRSPVAVQAHAEATSPQRLQLQQQQQRCFGSSVLHRRHGRRHSHNDGGCGYGDGDDLERDEREGSCSSCRSSRSSVSRSQSPMTMDAAHRDEAAALPTAEVARGSGHSRSIGTPSAPPLIGSDVRCSARSDADGAPPCVCLTKRSFAPVPETLARSTDTARVWWSPWAGERDSPAGPARSPTSELRDRDADTSPAQASRGGRVASASTGDPAHLIASWAATRNVSASFTNAPNTSATTPSKPPPPHETSPPQRGNVREWGNDVNLLDLLRVAVGNTSDDDGAAGERDPPAADVHAEFTARQPGDRRDAAVRPRTVRAQRAGGERGPHDNSVDDADDGNGDAAAEAPTRKWRPPRLRSTRSSATAHEPAPDTTTTPTTASLTETRDGSDQRRGGRRGPGGSFGLGGENTDSGASDDAVVAIPSLVLAPAGVWSARVSDPVLAAAAAASAAIADPLHRFVSHPSSPTTRSFSQSSSSTALGHTQLRPEPADVAAASIGPTSLRSRSDMSDTPLLHSFRSVLSPCPSITAPAFSVVPCSATSRVSSPASAPAKMVQQRWRDQVRARSGASVSVPGSAGGTSPISSVPTTVTAVEELGRRGAAAAEFPSSPGTVMDTHGSPLQLHRPSTTTAASGAAWMRVHPDPSAGDGGGGGGGAGGVGSPLEAWQPLGSGRFAARLTTASESADCGSSVAATTVTTPAASRGVSPRSTAKPVIALARPTALRREGSLAHGTTTAAMPIATATGSGDAASSFTSPQLTESPAATSSTAQSPSTRWPTSATTTAATHTAVQSPWSVTPAEAAAAALPEACALAHPHRSPSQPQHDAAHGGAAAAASSLRVRPWSGAAVADSPVATGALPPRVRLHTTPLTPLPTTSASFDGSMRRVGDANAAAGPYGGSRVVAEGDEEVSRCSTPPPAGSAAASARRPSSLVWAGESISQRISQRVSPCISPGKWDASATRMTTGSFIFQRQTSRGSPLLLSTAAPRPASALSLSQSRSFTHASTTAAAVGGRARGCSTGSAAAAVDAESPPARATARTTAGQEGEPGCCFGLETELCGLPRYAALQSPTSAAAVPTTRRPRSCSSLPALPRAWDVTPRASAGRLDEEGEADGCSRATRYVSAALQLVPPPPLVTLASGAAAAEDVAWNGGDGDESGVASSPTAAQAQTTSTPPGSATTRASAPSAAAVTRCDEPASQPGGFADVAEVRSVSSLSSSSRWASPDVLGAPEPAALLAAALAMSGARPTGPVADPDTARTELFSALLDPALEAALSQTWMSPVSQTSPTWGPPGMDTSAVPGEGAALVPASRYAYAFSSLRGCRSRQEDNVMILPVLPVRTSDDDAATSSTARSADDKDDAQDADTGLPLLDTTEVSDAGALRFSCFGVFDGHCGDTVASLAAQHFPEHFEHVVRAYHDQWRRDQGDHHNEGGIHGCSRNSHPGTPRAPARESCSGEAASVVGPSGPAVEFQRVVSAALVQALVHLDLTLFDLLHGATSGRGTQRRDAGSTASIAAFYKLPPPLHSTDTPPAEEQEEEEGGAVPACVDTYRLCIANLGDSRAIVGSLATGEVLLRTTDHRIGSYPAEQARIVAAGGVVELGRLDGSLDVTRGLGDYRYKVDPAQWWSSATATAAAAAASSPAAPLCEVHPAAAPITVAAAARRGDSRRPVSRSSSAHGSLPTSRASTPSGECSTAAASAARALCWQSTPSSPRDTLLAEHGEDGSIADTHAPPPAETTAAAAWNEERQNGVAPVHDGRGVAAAATAALEAEASPTRASPLAASGASDPRSPRIAVDAAASPPATALTGNAVSNVADVYEWEVRRGDVLVMASDGVWDRMSAEEVLAFVSTELKTSVAAQALRVTGAAGPLRQLGAALDATPHRHASVEAASPHRCAATGGGPSAALCTPGGDGGDGGRDAAGATDAAHSMAVQAVARRLTEHVVNELSGGDNTTVIMVVFD